MSEIRKTSKIPAAIVCAGETVVNVEDESRFGLEGSKLTAALKLPRRAFFSQYSRGELESSFRGSVLTISNFDHEKSCSKNMGRLRGVSTNAAASFLKSIGAISVHSEAA